MKKRSVLFVGLGLTVLVALACASPARETTFPSHPPTRPLPSASHRPMSGGPAVYVDPIRGNDANDGSRTKPWKSLNRAIPRLKPGDTLLLRGGRYYEHVLISVSGTAKKPVTIRSHPGEMAIVDGGIREFFEDPSASWEPAPGGAEGEFRSAKTYPGLRDESATGPLLAGRFADSMVPLHGYLYRGDLASTNGYWSSAAGKTTAELEIYCGPGIWYNPETERIHIRMAHTNWKFLAEDDRYRGETDPRKLPLIIAAHAEQSPLSLENASHVRLQDLVVVGAGKRGTVKISGCENIELDGVTVYGGSRAVAVDHTSQFRLVNSACRGIAAPWTYRGHLKYRSAEARLFSDGGWMSEGNSDFELAYSEFTDSVDGVFIGNVARVDFHHNLLDNVSDDGIFLTATTDYDGRTHGGNTRVYQNLLSRCLTTFAFGVGHGRQKTIEGGKQTGAGVWIYRNVFDLRKPVPYHIPTSPDATEPSHGRVAADHGSPTWEPMYIYHNTVVVPDSPWRGYYPMSGAMSGGTTRRVFNNIFAYVVGMPGAFLEPPLTDFQADGNLHWGFAQGALTGGEFLAKFRSSGLFEQSRKSYPPGWTTNDRFADPKFAAFSGDWRRPFDLGLRAESPAINAGVVTPSPWPDPLRKTDKEKPDLGAIPAGVVTGRIGVRGRFSILGELLEEVHARELALAPAIAGTGRPRPSAASMKPVAILDGYPTEDPAVIRFILGKLGVPFESFGLRKGWLDTSEYSRYSAVAVVGWLVRAGVTPNVYTGEDLKNVRAYLEGGGTLLLSHDLLNVFASSAGIEFLGDLLKKPVKPGESMRKELAGATILKPAHPWVKHLDRHNPPRWLEEFRQPHGAQPLPTATGENIIGNSTGDTLLYRLRVGTGQLIYIGWQMGTFLPRGRGPIPTLEQEKNWEENYRILETILSDVGRRPAN